MAEMRLHGRGGQGTVMAAEMLANAFVLEGKYASVFPSFGIERRGSAVMAFTRFSDKPVREKTRVYKPEILMVLDPSLLEKPEIYSGFVQGGTIVATGKDPQAILAHGVRPSTIILVDGMADGKERYDGWVSANYFRIFDKNLFSLGEIEGQTKLACEVKSKGEGFNTLKLLFDGDRLVGVEGFGQKDIHPGVFSFLIRNRVRVGENKDLLLEKPRETALWLMQTYRREHTV